MPQTQSFWMTSPASAIDLLNWERRLGLRAYPDGTYNSDPDVIVWHPDEIPLGWQQIM